MSTTQLDYTSDLQVDTELDHLEALELNTPSATGPGGITDTAMINLCALYAKLRPVVKFIRGFLFWKPRWQAVIDNFTNSMDSTCSITPPPPVA